MTSRSRCDKRCDGPTYGRRDPKPADRTTVKARTTICDGSSSSSSPRLDRPAATRSRSTAGSRTATTAPGFGEREYVIRVPGKDTGAARDRPRGGAARQRARRRRSGSRRRSRRCSPTRRRSSPSSSSGRGMSADRAPRARRPCSRSRARCARSTSSASRSRRSFDSFRIVEEYAELAGERGAMVPGAYWEAREVARRIEAALARARARARCPATTTCWRRNFIAGEPVAPAREGQLWIVDWEYAGMGDRYFDLANFAINNELSEDEQEATARRLLRRARSDSRPAGGSPRCALFMFMSDFREAMWGLLQGTVSELDFDFGDYSTHALRPACRDGGRRPRSTAGWKQFAPRPRLRLRACAVRLCVRSSRTARAA